MRAYAGIGSRETPGSVLEEMSKLARILQEKDYWLRTGAAQGADQWFANGAGDKTLFYLPWPNYEQDFVHGDRVVGSKIGCKSPTRAGIELASTVHPNWSACSDGARKLHGRNSHIIMGLELNNPVEFVVCWTKDGGPTGGTGLGIRLAMKNNIPVINMYNFPTADKVFDALNLANLLIEA